MVVTKEVAREKEDKKNIKTKTNRKADDTADIRLHRIEERFMPCRGIKIQRERRESWLTGGGVV